MATRKKRYKSMPRWKQKLVHEFIRYFISVLYLAFFFGSFTWYRRAVLAQYGISYYNYGVAFVEALVLAKVVWLGEIIGIVREPEDKPLLYPTLKKAFVFTIFVALFSVVEGMVRGMIRGVGAGHGLYEEVVVHKFELLAKCVITFCAFIPFFAFREIAREIGEVRLWKLFFKRKEEPSEFGMPGAPA